MTARHAPYTLDTPRIRRAMADRGLSLTDVAGKLSVSEADLARWLDGDGYPPPNHLSPLADFLGIDREKVATLTERENPPRVPFRKEQNDGTRDNYVERAKDMGDHLRHLEPFLPFDARTPAPILEHPRSDYAALRETASRVRADMGVGPTDRIDMEHLLCRFEELHAVVVPVLWGRRARHENAMHIYLPESKTSWAYLNLDVDAPALKLWTAHELGHCLTPDLEGDEAEDFAEGFAAMLLVPHERAERAYATLRREPEEPRQVAHVLEQAAEAGVPADTVLDQINRYAEAEGRPQVELGDALRSVADADGIEHRSVSQELFGEGGTDGHRKPDVQEYLEAAERSYRSPMFKLLAKFFKATGPGPGYVKNVLDVSILDARSIHDALV